MKQILCLLTAVLCLCQARAGTFYDVLVTVTNQPSDGDKITINTVDRMWTNNAAGSPGTQIAIGAAIGATATNLYVHLSTYKPTGVQLVEMPATNQVRFMGGQGTVLSVSSSGTWAAIVITTNAGNGARALMLPGSVLPNSTRTNDYTEAARGLQDYSQLAISKSAKLMENYVDLDSAEQIANKDSYGGTNRANIQAGNTVMWMFMHGPENITPTNRGILFRPKLGNPTYAIIADPTNGFPAIGVVQVDGTGTNYIVQPLNYPLSTKPSYILTENDAILTFGGLATGYGPNPQHWTGTNWFTEITNSFLINCSFSGGTFSSPAVQGAMSLDGTLATKRATVSSLANGNNSALNFTNAVFVKIDTGSLSADFTICGILGGADGRELEIYNNTAFNMTIGNEDGNDPTPANRIVTLTGSSVSTTGPGFVALKYDTGQSRWLVKSLQQ